MVEETGPKMVFFALGPTWNLLSSIKVGQIHLKLIFTYIQLPKLQEQSILASEFLIVNIKLTKKKKKERKKERKTVILKKYLDFPAARN